MVGRPTLERPCRRARVARAILRQGAKGAAVLQMQQAPRYGGGGPPGSGIFNPGSFFGCDFTGSPHPPNRVRLQLLIVGFSLGRPTQADAGLPA